MIPQKPSNKKVNIKRLVKKLKADLESAGISVEKIMLFGSHLKGTNKAYSDIDLAVVSKDFTGIRFNDMERIIDSIKLDSRIEIHPFKLNDFNKKNPFANEIIKKGKIILQR